MTQPMSDRITFIMSPGAYRGFNYTVGETVHPDGFAALAQEDPNKALQVLEQGRPKAEIEVDAMRNAEELLTSHYNPLDVEVIVKQSLVDCLRGRKIGTYICFSVNSVDHTA